MKIVLGGYINGWKSFDSSLGTYLDENTVFEFKNNSVECIYTSHMIEHMPDNAVQNIINESHRMLESGGVLRICAPDALYYINSYKTDQNAFFKDEYGVGTGRNYKEEIAQFSNDPEVLLAHNLLCSMFCAYCDVPQYGHTFDKKIAEQKVKEGVEELIEWCVSHFDKNRIGHCNGFYAEKVMKMMLKAGFEKTFDMQYRQSHFKEIEKNEDIDLLIRRDNSFYAEGVK